MLLEYAPLFRMYNDVKIPLKCVIKENLVKLMFLIWKIAPEISICDSICENYILGLELSKFMADYLWYERMRSYKYNDKVLRSIFLNMANL
jgi:hypothetical protein